MKERRLAWMELDATKMSPGTRDMKQHTTILVLVTLTQLDPGAEPANFSAAVLKLIVTYFN